MDLQNKKLKLFQYSEASMLMELHVLASRSSQLYSVRKAAKTPDYILTRFFWMANIVTKWRQKLASIDFQTLEKSNGTLLKTYV